MFERFLPQTRQVVVLAQHEARDLRHQSIGAEHLLLGLLGQDEDPVAQALGEHGLRLAEVRERIVRYTTEPDSALDAQALSAFGIDLDAVRRAAEASFGPGALDPKRPPAPSGHIPFTKQAKKVLEGAVREAQDHKHNHIATGHLLLGLLDEGEGLTGRILADTNVDTAELRAEAARLIAGKAS
jgi:ATP-dependent Clp protease ATP-binding subunit ClpA